MRRDRDRDRGIEREVDVFVTSTPSLLSYSPNDIALERFVGCEKIHTTLCSRHCQTS